MTFDLLEDLYIDNSLRKELSQPFGRIIEASLITKKINKDARVFAVGDVTVATLLKLGYSPSISVFDYKSGRNARYFPIIRRYFGHPVEVKNARGVLSKSLWDTIRKAAVSKHIVGIRVIGEEDLASLACISFARNGDLVMYGMRNKGIAVIRVGPKIKRYVVSVLNKMSVKRNDY